MRLTSLAELLATAATSDDGRARVVVALPAADLRMVAAPEVLAAGMDQDVRLLAWRAGEREGFLVADLPTNGSGLPAAEGIWRAGVVVAGTEGPLPRLAGLDAEAGRTADPARLLPRWAQAVVDLHRVRPARTERIERIERAERRWEATAELLLHRQRALLAYLERMAGTDHRVASLASALDLLGWLPDWRAVPPC
jgi:hypothetical protein